MLARGSGERSDKTCIGAESPKYQCGSKKLLSPSILLGSDVHAETAPPQLANGIQARFFRVALFLYLVPPIKIFYHS